MAQQSSASKQQPQAQSTSESQPKRTPAEDLQPADDGSAAAETSSEKPDVSDRDAPMERHEKGPKSGGMGPKQ
jgi:hypothetical protein